MLFISLSRVCFIVSSVIVFETLGIRNRKKRVVNVWNIGTCCSELPHIPSKPDGCTRFVLLSDTHEQESNLIVPDGDILLHAGDFSHRGGKEPILKFNEFLGSLPHKHKVVIAGNHEVTFQPEFYAKWWPKFHDAQEDAAAIKSSLTNCIYLEDSEVSINGFRIYGSPWQPAFATWAFNLRTPEEHQKVWGMIPEGVDILMTHGPPRGHGDALRSGKASGCDILLNTIQHVQPALHVFGHIHEGYGVSTEGLTTCVNASNSTVGNKGLNNPIVVDMI